MSNPDTSAKLGISGEPKGLPSGAIIKWLTLKKAFLLQQASIRVRGTPGWP
jgi:hypothetical protein